MTEQGRAGGHSWFDSRAARRASDIALGAILVGVATLAIANISGAPFRRWDLLSEWFFPSVVGGLLVVVGAGLLVRGTFLGHRQPAPWSPKGLLLIVLIIGAALLAAWLWGSQLALQFGPSEFATLIVLGLALAVALARRSRVRAVGMALLGLVLSTVGTDLSTGVERLTMGLEGLADGLSLPVVALGLVVVADSAICLVSPALFLQLYARQVAGWLGPRVPTIAGIGMRVSAALAIMAACVLAFRLNNSTWDVGQLVSFGLFGVARRVLGWNRLLLILSLVWGAVLEENVRRAMLLSKGDPAIFAQRPFSATFLLLACCILLALAFLSAVPARKRSRDAA